MFFRTLIILCLGVPALSGADDFPVGKAIRVDVPPKVDGILDDEAWKLAPPIGDLVQKEPNAGEPASERTEIRVVYTRDALYLGFKCFESHPRQEWVVKQMGRDQSLYSDDRVEITLDSFHDHRNGYQFVTNPVGGMMDARIIENSKLQQEWDGIWYVKTSIDGEGWYAEFMIPFKTLGFNPNNSTWGFQFKRSIEHLNEADCWSWPHPEGQMHNMALAGNIEGFEGLSKGVGLDIKPFGAVGYNRDINRNPVSKGQATGGGDIFYRVTESMMASATFNTDFSQTEVDTRQINMTRFPLFFPEKRAFFLEDAGIFEFAPAGASGGGGGGSSSSDLVPFYSRKIGLVGGQEVPVDFGTKVSGTMGRFTLGLLDMKSRDSDVAPGGNFTVARVKTNFWKQSFLGALFTRGDPAGLTNNTVGGLDLKLGTGDFMGTKKIVGVTLFGLKSRTTGLASRDYSWGGQITYPNDFLNLKYTNKYVEENFIPGLGFVQRPGTHFTEYDMQIRPRPKHFLGIRQMTHEIYYSSYYDLRLRGVQSRSLKATPMSWQFNQGSRFSVTYQRAFERLWQPFSVHKGVSIPAGSYWANRGNVAWGNPSKKDVNLSATYDFGEFYGGSNHNLAGTIQWRKNEHMTTSFEIDQYFVRLPQGRFQTRLFLYKLAYSFSPFLTVSNFLQYDTDSQNVGVQSRLRWVVAPGNELFFVINHAWQENPLKLDRWESLATSVKTKFQYTFRF